MPETVRDQSAPLPAATSAKFAANGEGQSSHRRFLRLFSRRERWGLTGRGWLVLIVGVGAICYLAVMGSYPFLAVTERASTDVLVVEGWVHQYAIHAALDEFAKGSYRIVIATGGPVSGSGGYTNDFNTSASVGADLLRAAGIPAEVIKMAPSRVMDRDRTYGSAVALRSWLAEHNLHPEAVNVLTEDVHARRTRMLFERALAPQTKVGVIGARNPDYDPAQWWRYSEGVKEVSSEALGWIYARFLFYPSWADKGS